MTIQVTGILRDPMGKALPNKEIRVIATNGSLLVLKDAHAIETTDALGAYDFPLEDGEYIIDVLYDDEAVIAGSSIVNMGTPTPVTLSELFLYTTPLNPQQVISLQAEFQLLIDNLQNAFDTEKQEIRQQLIDGDASVLQLSQTFTNDRLGAEMAVITAQVLAGDASVLSQSLAYTDTAGNLLATDITAVQAANASALFQLTATTDAQGVENASIRTAIAAGIATAISTATATSNITTGDLQVLLTTLINAGDATILQQSGINAQSLNDATEAFLLDQLIISGDGSVAGYQAYTLAALGFLDVATGLWVDGPLSSSLRAHTISTADGQFASITDVMNTMTKPDGTLVANGTLISDVNGRIAGYRHSNDGVTTNFQIIADNFAVGHMEGSTFVGDLTYDTVKKLLQLNGNAIITGTMSVNALQANSITSQFLAADSVIANTIAANAITGREINAESTITAGAEYTATTMRVMTKGGIDTNDGPVHGVYFHFDTGTTGSLDITSAFGTGIWQMFTEYHDSLGTGTRIIFTAGVTRTNTDLILIVNGSEYNLGTTTGTMTHFYLAGIDVFGGFYNGELVNIQLKEIDVGTLNNNIAGMNGIDDNSGTGVDGIRFWAGTTAALAHSAPFRIDLLGNIFTGGNMNVEGTMELGRASDTANYVKFHGTNNAGSTNHFLQVRSANVERVRWDYDGRLRLFNSAGQSIMDVNPVAGTFQFSGTIQADQIVGDIVGAKIYGATFRQIYRKSYSTYYTSTVATVRVNTPQNFARTLVMPLFIETSAAFVMTNSENGVGDNGTAYGAIRATGDYGTHYSNEVYASGNDRQSGFNSGVLQMVINIPANTTGTIYLSGRLRETTRGVGTVTIQGTTGGQLIAQIFKGSNDLT